MCVLCLCLPAQSDSTFELERRRHVAVRYDRALMASTIRAMSRISAIRAAREARLHAQRMRVKRTVERQAAQRELKQNAELLKAPQLSAERRSVVNALRERSRAPAAAAAARERLTEPQRAAGTAAGARAGLRMEEVDAVNAQ